MVYFIQINWKVAYIDDYNYKLVVSESCPLDDFILWYFYIEINYITLIKVDYRTSCALELKKQKDYKNIRN